MQLTFNVEILRHPLSVKPGLKIPDFLLDKRLAISTLCKLGKSAHAVVLVKESEGNYYFKNSNLNNQEITIPVDRPPWNSQPSPEWLWLSMIYYALLKFPNSDMGH